MRTHNKFPAERTNGRIYDWEVILDGQIHSFRRGEDFDCRPKSFVSRCNREGLDRGLRVVTRIIGDPETNGVAWVQADRS